MKLWHLIIVYAAAIVVFFLYRDELAGWMANDRPALFVSFAVALCFVAFPVLPYKIIIGMLGFMYGPLVGFLISWSAATIASTILYMLVRTTFQKQGRAYLAKFERIDHIAAMMERHPFATLLTARLIPVLPQSLVNIYPAFLSIKLPTYVVASALGKIPSILLFSYLGQQLFANFRNALIVIGVYALLLALTTIVYRLWRLKNRH